MNRKSASITKSSNAYNYTTMKTGSTTTRTKYGSKTKNTFNKQVYNKQGELVGTTNSIQVIKSNDVTSGIIGSTLGLLATLLILINMWLVLSGSGEFRGLEWLLNILSNAPAIPTGWLEAWAGANIDATSWGVFEFLANFFNRINDLLNVIAFIGTGAINILLFVLYFIGAFLFVGA